MNNVYLQVFSQIDQRISVPLETAITIFTLQYCKCDCIQLNFVLDENAVTESSVNVKIPMEWKPLVISSGDISNEIKKCVLPVAVESDSRTYIAGLCLVLRFIIRKVLSGDSSHYSKALLGFRNSCLAACAEASIWTKFCEVTIIDCVKHLIQLNHNNLLHDNTFTFPVDVLRYEYHLSQDIRIHNVRKRQQVHMKSQHTSLSHAFAEGPDLTLSDIILFTCFHFYFMLISSPLLKQHIPLVTKWYQRMINLEQIHNASLLLHQDIQLFRPAEITDVKIPEIQKESLYRSDPKRYKPQRRLYTRQSDVDEAFILLQQAGLTLLEYKELTCMKKLWNWDNFPDLVHPEGGGLPTSRVLRKCQQLENLAKVVVNIAKDSDVIVDFCSGGGHLGIVVAYLLPKCTVILVENKEESVSRARSRVSNLRLTNIHIYQCNLDYFCSSFDIGMSLHACGIATDLVIQCCLNNSAAFISCPCCYGGIESNHIIQYPCSNAFTNSVLDLKHYMVLSHSSDQTHDDLNKKTYQGKLCMKVIDTDRCLNAKENGYWVNLSILMPDTCTPKNHLLVGIPQKRMESVISM